ncbi:Uma2 family endonuclease [bacterium]|nr:MAG: Uma2 family endonuclease [bacterium]
MIPKAIKRWTVDQYLDLAEKGFLRKAPHVELIDGVIYDKAVSGHRHMFAFNRLDGFFRENMGHVASIFVRGTVRLGTYDGLEPDIAVFRGSYENYRCREPLASELIWVVEIIDAPLDDFQDKAPVSARFGIPEFWLVDVKGRRVLVHRSPSPESETWGEVLEVGEAGSIAPLGQTESVRVAEILPAPDVP